MSLFCFFWGGVGFFLPPFFFFPFPVMFLFSYQEIGKNPTFWLPASYPARLWAVLCPEWHDFNSELSVRQSIFRPEKSGKRICDFRQEFYQLFSLVKYLTWVFLRFLEAKGEQNTTGSCSAVRAWVDIWADPGSSAWLEVLVLSSQQEKHPLSRLASAPLFAWLGKHMCQAEVFGNQTSAWLI